MKLHSCFVVALVFALIGISALTGQGQDVIVDTRNALSSGNLRGAQNIIARYRSLYGNTPEAFEADSWIMRVEWLKGDLQQAYDHAREIQRLSEAALKGRKLDSEPHLAIALGAALEVEAQVLNSQNQKSEAVSLLQAALTRWGNTSIAERLRKNLNLLSLTGQPAPSLSASDWIGVRPPALNSLRGKPVLLFFWAHWCPDCKAEGPLLARLYREFEPKGLRVLGPTKLYGYAGSGEDAAPHQEKQYIERIFAKYYSHLAGIPVPLDATNFDRYGASTTPTLVLIDKHGIVRLYHPGAMTEAELRSAIQRVL